MQDRHKNRQKYFNEQVSTTENYVLPYLNPHFIPQQGNRVLEIGCGEGGNLLPFLNLGCDVTGIDLNERKIDNARRFLSERSESQNYTLILKDIYDIEPGAIGQFDLIMMRDVIEHIHNQEKFISFIKPLLKSEGVIFFGFPPWYMPFGGHQQMCESKILSTLPYFHLLPGPIYRGILRLFGERTNTIRALSEIKETGIGINRFERILRNSGYSIKKSDLFFINPNYRVKFGLTPRKVWSLPARIPYIRDFYTTCYYGVIGQDLP